MCPNEKGKVLHKINLRKCTREREKEEKKKRTWKEKEFDSTVSLYDTDSVLSISFDLPRNILSCVLFSEVGSRL